MRTLGFAQSSPTSLYLWCHVRMQIRLFFATQQLRDTARLWWDHYKAMLPADHIVIWDEFKNAFRAHHIPEGLMERKLNEFLALTHGTHTVIQYVQAFNNLCHYAG